jgi:hypothetical protein
VLHDQALGVLRCDAQQQKRLYLRAAPQLSNPCTDSISLWRINGLRCQAYGTYKQLAYNFFEAFEASGEGHVVLDLHVKTAIG